MDGKRMKYAVRVAVVSCIFASGFLCGSLTQRNADAQMGELMKQAAGGGGIIGTAAELGTAITDMQQQVNGLQKNLEILKKIKGSLGGHK